jgi:hypothetical protein
MQMREVYMQAERVLVFDSELMASTAEASYEELNMRIKCSRSIQSTTAYVSDGLSSLAC